MAIHQPKYQKYRKSRNLVDIQDKIDVSNTSTTPLDMSKLPLGTPLTLSVNIECTSGTARARLDYVNAGGTTVFGGTAYISSGRASKTVTIPTDAKSASFVVQPRGVASFRNIQIETGSVANEYEPYGAMFPDGLGSAEVVPFHGDHEPVSVVQGRKSRNLYSDNFEEYSRVQDYWTRPIKLENGWYRLSVQKHPDELESGFVIGIVKSSRRYNEFVNLNTFVSYGGVINEQAFMVGDDWTDPALAVYLTGQQSKETFDALFSRYDIQLEKVNAHSSPATPYEPYGTVTDPIYIPQESTKSGTELEFEPSYNHTAEVSVFGRSTQDGTPTPDSPQPIESVESVSVGSRGRNLFDKDYWIKAPNTQSYKGDGENCLIASANGDGRGWGTFLVHGMSPYLKAGAYTFSQRLVTLHSAASIPRYEIKKLKSDGSIVTVSTNVITKDGVSVTFSLDEDCYVGFKVYDGTYAAVENWATVSFPMLELGTTAHPYEPYRSSRRTIDLQGHELRSLPDGTKDEVRVYRDGRVELVQRIRPFDLSSQSWMYQNTWKSWYTDYMRIESKGYDTANYVAEKYQSKTFSMVTNERQTIASICTTEYDAGRANRIIVKTLSDTVKPSGAFIAAWDEPQTIQLPSIDPLDTFYPYTFIDADGLDLSANVLVIE